MHRFGFAALSLSSMLLSFGGEATVIKGYAAALSEIACT